MQSRTGRYRIVWDEEETGALRAAGLLDLTAVLSREDLEPVKAVLAARQVHRLRLPDGRTVYVKRYFATPLRDALGDRLLGPGYDSGAGREWVALRRLAALGVRAPRPLAFGEERRFGLVRRAFLVTEGLDLAGTLEDLAYGRVAGSPASADERRRLVRVVATVLRTLHEGGVNHRDFYLGHLALERSRGGVCVLDLNRADVRERVPRRWRVKDAAALHFSTPARLVGPRDRVRFLRAYAGPRTPRRDAFQRDVEAKAARMLVRARRKIARGDENIHIND